MSVDNYYIDPQEGGDPFAILAAQLYNYPYSANLVLMSDISRSRYFMNRLREQVPDIWPAPTYGPNRDERYWEFAGQDGLWDRKRDSLLTILTVGDKGILGLRITGLMYVDHRVTEQFYLTDCLSRLTKSGAGYTLNTDLWRIDPETRPIVIDRPRFKMERLP